MRIFISIVLNNTLTQFDKIFLAISYSTTELAYYLIASSIGGMPIWILGERLAAIYIVEIKKSVNKIYSFLQGVIVILLTSTMSILLLEFFGVQIILLLFGGDYAPAYQFVTLSILISTAQVLRIFLSSVARGLGLHTFVLNFQITSLAGICFIALFNMFYNLQLNQFLIIVCLYQFFIFLGATIIFFYKLVFIDESNNKKSTGV